MASSDAYKNINIKRDKTFMGILKLQKTPRSTHLFDLRIFLLRLDGQTFEVVLQRFQQSDGVLVVGDGRRRRRAAGRSPVSHDGRWRRRHTYTGGGRFALSPSPGYLPPVGRRQNTTRPPISGNGYERPRYHHKPRTGRTALAGFD